MFINSTDQGIKKQDFREPKAVLCGSIQELIESVHCGEIATYRLEEGDKDYLCDGESLAKDGYSDEHQEAIEKIYVAVEYE